MRLWVLPALLVLAPACAMAADCNNPAPIQFPANAKSVTLSSGPPSGTSDCYRLTAQSNQKLTVTLDSANDDAVFSLYAPGWTASCSQAGDCEFNGDSLSEEGTSAWSDTLEASGDYLIVIDNSRSDGEYQLTVEFE